MIVKARRGGRAAGLGRGGSRSGATAPRSTSQSSHSHDSTSSILDPGEIVLDSLGMHFTADTSAPFDLGMGTQEQGHHDDPELWDAFA